CLGGATGGCELERPRERTEIESVPGLERAAVGSLAADRDGPDLPRFLPVSAPGPCFLRSFQGWGGRLSRRDQGTNRFGSRAVDPAGGLHRRAGQFPFRSGRG